MFCSHLFQVSRSVLTSAITRWPPMIPRPWDNIVTGCVAMSPTRSTINLCCCNWKRSTSESFFPLSLFTSRSKSKYVPLLTSALGHDTFFPRKLQTRNEHDIKGFFNELPCQPRPLSFLSPTYQKRAVLCCSVIFAYAAYTFKHLGLPTWISSRYEFFAT